MTISQKIVISILFIQILIGETPYVVMVSFDGFRYDYSERVDTPYFDYIRDNGAKANSIQPVFPTKTFPNHYSLATGAYTQTHMLTGNSFYDKKFKEKYSISNRKVVQNPKWYMAEPIWVTAERQGVQTASYFWVGSEAPIKGVFPSIYKYYDGSVTYESRVDSVIAWLQLPEATRPHLVMLYFDEPDHTGHEFGPNSPELDKKIMYLDHILGLLINNLFSLLVADEINLIVVSDHGMTPTSDERIINLNTFIKTDNYIIDNSGPFAQITPRFFWQRFLFKNRFEKNPHLTVYPKKSIPHRYHFVNRNTRDFLLVAEDGWTITSGKTNNKYDSISLGNHGYDPQVKNMHGIFYAMGPAIKQGVTIETFENIHVYPFVCELLEIKPYHDQPDSPEGNLEILSPILREPGR